MSVAAGSQFTAVINLVRAQTGEPVGAQTVYLQLFTVELGDFIDVTSAFLNDRGHIEIKATLPRKPGVYRYRARFAGAGGLAPDTSPAVKVEVV